MHLPRFIVAAAATVVLTACSAGGAPTPSVSTVSSSAIASASPAETAAGQGIHVTLTDALKMDPAGLTVKVGQPVRFVVTNAGAIPHEFYIGDQVAQDAHEKEMMAGAMAMDEPDGIALKPGETKELTHTFAVAGAFLAGCHEPGHYGAGMKASIMVVP